MVLKNCAATSLLAFLCLVGVGSGGTSQVVVWFSGLCFQCVSVAVVSSFS